MDHLPVLDIRGQYGMSNVVFGLGVNNTNDGRDMVQFFNKPHIRHLFSTDLNWLHLNQLFSGNYSGMSGITFGICNGPSELIS